MRGNDRVSGSSNGVGGLQDAVFERLLRERVVVLGSQVDDEVANRLCAQVLLLAAEDPRRDIHLYVNSPGGSVDAGLAVYDTMQFVDCDVATYGFGMAASMGQFLLTAGAPGKRYVLPHTRVLMHQPSGGVGGTQADIAIQAEQIERDSDRDRWFTPEEARDYGLVDHVLSRADALPGGGPGAPTRG